MRSRLDHYNHPLSHLPSEALSLQPGGKLAGGCVCDCEAGAGSSSPGSVSKLLRGELIRVCAGVCRRENGCSMEAFTWRCWLLLCALCSTS